MSDTKFSAGVQQLIDRLRDDGIAEGKSKADALVEEAHHHAKGIIDKAQKDADQIIRNAITEAEHTKRTARDAVKLAARDTILDLKSVLVNQFSLRLGELVSEALTDKDFIKQVILEIAGRVQEETKDKDIKILLPEDIIGLDELRRNPERVKEGDLGQFVLFVAKEILRKGVSIGNHQADEPGLTITLVQDDLQIDLHEPVITDILLAHLLPRFRALLEGSIQ